MIVQIEAEDIDGLLAEDECLVPSVEDLLLDALIIYRDTPKSIYKPKAQITTTNDLNIRITIAPDLPDISRNGNHKNGRSET